MSGPRSAALSPASPPAEHTTLDAIPVAQLRGVGPKMAARLAGLGIGTVQDLLFHLPLRYQDRTRLTPMSRLRPGQEALVEGELRSAAIAGGRRRSLICQLADCSGSISLRFFHFSPAQRKQLQPGARLQCFGEVRRGASGLEMIHPEYRRHDAADTTAVEATLTPIYPGTEGIHQAGWRKLIAQALALMTEHPPVELLHGADGKEGIGLAAALAYLHCPPQQADQRLLADRAHPAQRRLILEELVAHHMGLLNSRRKIRRFPAHPLPPQPERVAALLGTLPFAPTRAQQRVTDEIGQDLNGSQPMLRLLQGDVGAGKTLVAALAALRAVAAGHQVAIMAPTELLAQQHFAQFTRWFEPLGIRIAWLVSRLKGKARDEQLQLIAGGGADIAVGTHALFQSGVTFSQLSLVIIDEQHRFGVHQRLQLRNKGQSGDCMPHQLVMTATPIPRTLAMSAYADLDCSVIDELPPGRRPVTTVAVADSRRGDVLERVRLACRCGHQVYWVCTLIEESEALQAKAAESTAVELQAALPEYRVGLVHGRLAAAEKIAAMAAFKAARTQLLVATTVIEVGVDVPNASLMIIENPERLGLAQLHQLRGRVGRGAKQSHCVLLYQAPLSKTGRARLQAMRESNDGFAIAERDLELRGPGELLGTRQTGALAFRIADLQRDQRLIEPARRLADEILQRYPERMPALTRRWLPGGDAYLNV